jgi:hypothetical protein
MYWDEKQQRGLHLSGYVLSARKKPRVAPKRANARVLQALDSMAVLAEFARDYRPGSRIPRSVWAHADIMGEYLGYPPAKDWLPGFLNRSLEG